MFGRFDLFDFYKETTNNSFKFLNGKIKVEPNELLRVGSKRVEGARHGMKIKQTSTQKAEAGRSL